MHEHDDGKRSHRPFRQTFRDVQHKYFASPSACLPRCSSWDAVQWTQPPSISAATDSQSTSLLTQRLYASVQLRDPVQVASQRGGGGDQSPQPAAKHERGVEGAGADLQERGICVRHREEVQQEQGRGSAGGGKRLSSCCWTALKKKRDKRAELSVRAHSLTS